MHRDLHLYLPFSEPGRVARLRRWRTHRANRRIAAGRIAAERPDVIFVWSQLRLTLGAGQAERSGIPVCYTFNDEHLAGYLPRPWSLAPRAAAAGLVDRLVLRGQTTAALRLESTTCISQRVRANLVASGLQVPAGRVIYQGIPVERFPCKAEPGAIGAPARILLQRRSTTAPACNGSTSWVRALNVSQGSSAGARRRVCRSVRLDCVQCCMRSAAMVDKHQRASERLCAQPRART